MCCWLNAGPRREEATGMSARASGPCAPLRELSVPGCCGEGKERSSWCSGRGNGGRGYLVLRPSLCFTKALGGDCALSDSQESVSQRR